MSLTVQHAELLGSGTLDASLRNARTGKASGIPHLQVRWQRVENAPSYGQVVIAARYRYDGTIRRMLTDVESWANELVVSRDGVTIWEGPVTGWTENEGRLTLNAFDHLTWAQYTPAGTLDYAGDAALVVAQVLQERLYGADGTGPIRVDARAAGVAGVVKNADPIDAYLLDSIQQSIGETLVSFRAIGDTIRIRGTDDARVVARLHDGHYTDGSIGTSNNGTERPDQFEVYGATVDGARLVGRFPPSVTLTPRGRFPVVRGFARDFLTTQAEVDAHAQNLWRQANANGGNRLELPTNASLSPLAPIAFRDLEPGNLVVVELRDQMTGFITPTTMRIVEVVGQAGSVDGANRDPQGQFTSSGRGDAEFVQITLRAWEVVSTVDEWTFTPDVPDYAPPTEDTTDTGSAPPRNPAPPAGEGTSSGPRGPVGSAPGLGGDRLPV